MSAVLLVVAVGGVAAAGAGRPEGTSVASAEFSAVCVFVAAALAAGSATA